MHVTAVTDPGNPDVPNEDWHAVTDDLIVVLDGATIRTDTGCSHGAAWYARKLGAAIISRTADPARPLTEALAGSIRDVAALHPGCDLTHPGTPSAAVGVVRLDGDSLRYLVLGDVTVLIESHDGEVVEVSDQRITASAEAQREEAHRYPIGSPEKDEALREMKYAELAARGVEYWVAAADPSAAGRAITGDVPSASVRRLAVLTDGAARYVDLFHPGVAAADVLRLLARSGPRMLVELVRGAEEADPRGVRFPRNKRSDDATVVCVDFGPVVPPRTPVVPGRAGELAAMTVGLFGDGRTVTERR